jgi:hypothetical protein
MKPTDAQLSAPHLAERARREAERLRNEDLIRQKEREADQKLALKIIELGYKALAKELHPDKGGSTDAMSRLTRARDHLRKSIGAGLLRRGRQ